MIMKNKIKKLLATASVALLAACGGGGDNTSIGGIYTTGEGTAQTQSKDYTNVTDFTKLGLTLINAVNLVNEKLLATPSYLDDLFTSNSVVISVPIQNYFGSDIAGDMTRAEMLVTTLKYDFPVEGTANKKPYRVEYSEYDSTGKAVYTLSASSIYGCSNANDIKNPTASCVKYEYYKLSANTVEWQWGALGAMPLVKTEAHGLVYLSALLP